MYLLHPGMDITEVIICQSLYWPGIRKYVQKELYDCDTCQLTNRPKQNAKLPAKQSEEKYGTNSG